MNDLSWCGFLRAIAECIKANRIKGALDVANSVSMDNMTDSQMRLIRGTCFVLRKHGDHATYVAEQLRRIDRAIKNHGGDSIYERPRTIMVDLETHMPFANTGRDAYEQMVKDFTELMNTTINTDAKAMAQLVNADFSNIERRIVAATTPTMNKTQYVQHLEAELVTAKVAEANDIEAAARKAKLDAYLKLASATTALLHKIAAPDTYPLTALAFHRFELKALAAEFGYRIVLVGDRTQAVLVQQ